MTASQSQPCDALKGAATEAEPSASITTWRKRPVIVEAVQITAADWNGGTWDGCPFTAVPEWLSDAMQDGILWPDTPNHTDYAEWRIKTLEGVVPATPGDWIIRGVMGELYPCRGDIFAATYEPAPPSAEAKQGRTGGGECSGKTS